jgi:hypothetical protein
MQGSRNGLFRYARLELLPREVIVKPTESDTTRPGNVARVACQKLLKGSYTEKG